MCTLVVNLAIHFDSLSLDCVSDLWTRLEKLVLAGSFGRAGSCKLKQLSLLWSLVQSVLSKSHCSPDSLFRSDHVEQCQRHYSCQHRGGQRAAFGIYGCDQASEANEGYLGQRT